MHPIWWSGDRWRSVIRPSNYRFASFGREKRKATSSAAAGPERVALEVQLLDVALDAERLAHGLARGYARGARGYASSKNLVLKV